MKFEVNDIIEEMSVVRKSTILVVVMTFGVFFVGSFALFGFHQLKSSYDVVYDSHMQTSTLNKLKTHYGYNLLYTLSTESNNTASLKRFKEDGATLWQIYESEEFDPEERTPLYTKLTAYTSKKIDELHAQLLDKTISQAQLLGQAEILQSNLDKLTQFHHKDINTQYDYVNGQYWFVFWMTLILVLALVGFSLYFANSIKKKVFQNIEKIQNIVSSKMIDIQRMSHNFEEKVAKEVHKNREKDQIMNQQARLASMGEMIGNIAHQWRQPLNALTLLIQSFGTKSMQGKLDQAFIDQQVNEGLRLAEQMSHTIEDFRNFFSPHRDREYFSLEQSVRDTLELVEFFCKDEHIDIIVQSKEDMRVFGYSNEFSQVILNLINNARDNFKHRNINDQRKILIKIEKKIKPKPYAIISFIDNGGGIDPKIKDRIFEPYFTTKHKSTGTGIGLYMSKQIIEKQMQGLVTMKNTESRLGTDTVYRCAQFIIALPLK